ncbi:MAG TPA: glyoxalase [Verrucomicrobiales bacterium]|nr:glyoxalase [Verrucomicrobiales bacterium]
MKPDSLPVESVNHIARVAHDLEASIAFYRDVLGFHPIERPNFGFPGAWLINFGVQIHLIAATGDPDLDGSGISIRAGHIAFHVPDPSEIENLLKQHGITYKANYATASGITQYFFHDPDGNHIEIGSYPPIKELKSSPQKNS